MRRHYLWPRRGRPLHEILKAPSPIRVPETAWMVDIKRISEYGGILFHRNEKKR
jgi:hypothetical protein